MKLRELPYMFGLRPKPKTYPYEVKTFDLPKDGRIQYAQWLHPSETEKGVQQESIEELRKFIRPGDVAIDIGAHTGDSTLPIALAAGPEGCVLALEPNPYVFEVLKKNAELNPNKAKIIPLMFAATPNAGEFDFEYSDAGFCNGGFHAGINRWRHGHAFKLRVTGVNLQAYLAENFPDLLPRLRYVKVDAEGFDYEVLASLKDLISAQRPYINAEMFKLLDLPRRERLYDFLAGLEYDIFRIESNTCYRGPRLARQDLMIRRHFDVFCVPNKSELTNK